MDQAHSTISPRIIVQFEPVEGATVSVAVDPSHCSSSEDAMQIAHRAIRQLVRERSGAGNSPAAPRAGNQPPANAYQTDELFRCWATRN